MFSISSGIRFFGQAVFAAAALNSLGVLIHGQDLRVVAPHQHAPASIRQLRQDGTAESFNWSGYAVTGANGSVTAVSGSWTVPQSVCSKGEAPAYAAFWVGIDGWSSDTVEQIGTDSDCAHGVATYYAWYEFYPEPAFYAGPLNNISPGDLISAKVVYDAANGAFVATITDVSAPAELSFTTVYRPNKYTGIPQRSSAEWIAEAPSNENGALLPLAEFGVVSFGEAFTSVSHTNAATVNGVTGPIGSFGSTNVWKSIMVTDGNPTSNFGAPMGTPSALFDPSSFWITWFSVGP
jgi:hypothetical protein